MNPNSTAPNNAPVSAAPKGPEATTLSLPKGGGALRAVGEKLTTQAVTGSCTASIPLPMSPGRGDAPSLALAYDSGGGNSPYGLGWSLGVPAITRKTEKGLPCYDDDHESDVFVLSGAEDLVPQYREDESLGWVRDEPANDDYFVRRYRPRVEGAFARIERWTSKSTGEVHWRATTPDNVTSLYGASSDSRITDPNNARHVFSWLLDKTYDDKGRVTMYEYVGEDLVGVDPQAPEERHRTGTQPQRYLKRVRYGNNTPGSTTAFHFDLVLDYGDHDPDAPTPTADRDWALREDPFSTYRAGFEIRTRRLCQRALMFHTFTELGESPCLVRALALEHAADPVATQLIGAALIGYVRDSEGAYTSLASPATEFDYTPRTLHTRVQALPHESLVGLPAGLSAPHQWVDLDGEGLSGVLSEQAGAWWYKRNLGDGKLSAPELLPARPSFALQSGSLGNLVAAGPLQLIVTDGPSAGYFTRERDGAWGPFRAFESAPNIDWHDPHLRHIDLDGDGEADLLVSRDEVFVWYPSLGEKGYGPPRTVQLPLDERRGPRVVFSDPREMIFLADMSGDGLMDLVRVRNAQVVYWPNLGHGRFGAMVTMGNAPVLDAPDLFDASRVRLADIDGSGPTDLIYLGSKGVSVYFNEAGNHWSAGQSLSNLPIADAAAHVEVLDLLANGTSALVWSSPLSPEIRYVDLMGSEKPHLLRAVRNNLGAETRYAYAPSTRFYTADRLAGKPWITKLPFPVHVLERVEVRDGISGTRLVQQYAYHHGYYDREEKEFRGFGMVEQWDTETYEQFTEPGLFPETPSTVDPETYSPPVRTRTWFHTGAYFGRKTVSLQHATEYYALAHTLKDTELPDGLTPAEQREACRALRGQALRVEVCGLDGSELQEIPYTVSESAFSLRRVQPMGSERHGVFLVMPRETIATQLERNAADPRVQHSLTLEVDELGHVTKSASVTYPRVTPAYDEQGITLITATVNTVANYVAESDWYRHGLPVESIGYELTKVLAPAEARYSVAELALALSTATAIAYEATPSTTACNKRVISHVRTTYLANNLSAPLALGTVESLALPYRSYALAFTAGLLADVFDTDVTSTMLEDEGGYIAEEDDYWAPSGHVVFDADHFYLPSSTVDPFGNTSTVTYDDYFLLPVSTTDAIGNSASVVNDYRVLGPKQLTDANGNITLVSFDARGAVVAMAVQGKSGDSDGDTLADPTATYEYHPFAWVDGDGPVCAKSRMRERHADSGTPWQESWTYWDGFGREILKKAQAEPGMAPARTEGGSVQRDPVTGAIVLADTSPALRWVGTGRTVFNNKGDAVKTYEPFFSALPDFEDEADIVAVGVTPVMHHDALGRVVRVDLPDGTFTKVVFDPWHSEAWDANDTVLDSSWYTTRHALSTSDPDYRAATLSAAAAGTPTITHFDTLGRATRVIADNGDDVTFTTITALNIQGKPLSVTDARAVLVATYTNDVAGRPMKTVSADAGTSRVLLDVMGQPVRSFTARSFVQRIVYDALRRPKHRFITPPGDDEFLATVTVFGEAVTAATDSNLLGRVYQVFDGAGVVTTPSYDFKGNPVESTRRFVTAYATDPDWSDLASHTAAADIATAAESLLGSDSFTTQTEYDALNRPTRVQLPDASDMRPAYNEAGLFESLDGYVRGASTATTFVTDVDYDAKGRRERIAYGNGVETTYTYDPKTFRLTRLRSTRNDGDDLLQNDALIYDANGQIVQRSDESDPTLYFTATVSASTKQLYEYDAIGRLVSATGREHPGTLPVAQTDYTDGGRGNQPHPNDASAIEDYTESYDYDAVGNILRLLHSGESGSWSRRYAYATDSNRLDSTSLPGDDPDGPYSVSYADKHDDAGNLTWMPHLATIAWDHDEKMRSVDLGGGGTAYYQYDAAGQRVRKVIDRTSTLQEERLYIGVNEVYRYRISGDVDTQRETLRVMDDTRAIAELDTLVVDGGDAVSSPVTMYRYALEDLLGSRSVEVDQDAAIVAHEWFHPYGTTAFEAKASGIEVPERRYRYTGMERDEETGLQRHGVRYYAPWLGRWVSADPAGMVDGTNRYQYASGDPSLGIDTGGQATTSPDGRRFVALTDKAALRNSFHSFTEHALSSSQESAANAAIGTSSLAVLSSATRAFNTVNRPMDRLGTAPPRYDEKNIASEPAGDVAAIDALLDLAWQGIRAVSVASLGIFLLALSVADMESDENPRARQLREERAAAQSISDAPPAPVTAPAVDSPANVRPDATTDVTIECVANYSRQPLTDDEIRGWAEELGRDARADGLTGRVTVTVTSDGAELITFSGTNFLHSPSVRSALNAVPRGLRRGWHGECGEPAGASGMEGDDRDNPIHPLEGMRQATAAIFIPDRWWVAPGTLVAPCNSCRIMQRLLGIRNLGPDVDPPRPPGR